MKLEIISTSVINHYNISGIASSVIGAVYRIDGKEEMPLRGRSHALTPLQ